MVMTAGQFQTTHVVCRSTTETKKIAVQPIPKLKSSARNRTGRKVDRQWPVPGAADVFPKLFFVRRENADAPPSA